MAVHVCIKQVILENGEDDDGPIIFRRTSSSSKQNQLSSTSKKLSSQKSDGFVTKQTSSNLNASKYVSSPGFQKDKAAASSSKILAEKSNAVSSSSPASVNDRAKNLLGQKLAVTSPFKTYHSNKSFALTENFDDSDVEMPISVRLNASSKGNNYTVAEKVHKQSSASSQASVHDKAKDSSGQKLAATSPFKTSNSIFVAENPNDSAGARPIRVRFNAPSMGDNSMVAQKVHKQSSASSQASVHVKIKGSSGQKLAAISPLKTSNSIFVAENPNDSVDERPIRVRINAFSMGDNSMVAQKVHKQSSASSQVSVHDKAKGSSGQKLAATSPFKTAHSIFVAENPNDSEDERPINVRFNASSMGDNSTVAQKVHKQSSASSQASVHDKAKGSSGQKLAATSPFKTSHSIFVAENPNDSDDERPISVRLNASSKGNNYTAAQKVHKQSLASSQASVHDKAKGLSDQKLVAISPFKTSHSFSALAENSDDSEYKMPIIVRLNPSSKGNNFTVAQTVHKQPSASGLAKCPTGQSMHDSLNGSGRGSNDSDDDDNVMLNAKFSSATGASQRSNSLLATKASIKESFEDSDDEKPLLSRLQAKFSGAASMKLDSYEKPLSFKTANGYVKKESIDSLKSPKGSSKRPAGDTNNFIGTAGKKTKVLGSSIPIKVKQEEVVKKELMDDDHIPISQRMKKPASSGNQVCTKKEIKKTTSFKKDGKKTKTLMESKYSKSSTVPPGSGGGQKWTTLVHNGVIFPPPYKPHGIKMLYNGRPVDLTPEQEEVATMFAVMKDTDYATKTRFIENFMNDWSQILGKNHVIKKFELCDFTPIYEWHLMEKEKKKQMSSEEKKQLKEDKMKLEEKYMWAIVDGVKEKVGNFRVEPPALFRGRGEHPKMGKLKRRIRPREITINIGKDAPIPECPIPGERWREVKHDNTVTWLAYWSDPINSKECKYVFLAASSSLKGQSDKEKYEKARMLKKYIQNIRANYTKDFTNKDATKRQIAVATYLIDKLALRAGNEKDDDEADTVGCCTLKVENVTLVPPNKLEFDFLGKDSIRYFNTVEVELAVYKAIAEFRTARRNDGRKKAEGDDLFDLLDTSKLNAHLKELMPGLTAKVFRTYNASITLDVMLSKETKVGNVPEKVAVYQIANKEVAIICNHQRTVSKSHETQMSRLNEKIDELKAQRKELEVDLSKVRRGKPFGKVADGKPEKSEKQIAQIDDKIEKLELQKKTKEDLKTVALGTSKINYLDPRITVAWCKRHEVPIEKIFNKSLLAKFAWAMDVDPEFRF